MLHADAFPRECGYCKQPLTCRSLCFDGGHNDGKCQLRLFALHSNSPVSPPAAAADEYDRELGEGGWEDHPEDLASAAAAAAPLQPVDAAASAFLLAADAAVAAESSDESDADLEEREAPLLFRSVPLRRMHCAPSCARCLMLTLGVCACALSLSLSLPAR